MTVRCGGARLEHRRHLSAYSAQGHTEFLTTNQADWANVRKTTNYQSNGPVTDVTSSDIRCYQLAAGNEGATTAPIQAGSTVTYNVKASISHPGPFSAWLAKVPAGQTAATYDGSGAEWFKIYQEEAQVSSSGLKWASSGKLSRCSMSANRDEEGTRIS